MIPRRLFPHAGIATALVVGGLALGAQDVWGQPAEPRSISVDCGLVNGVTPTVIVGQPGDTFSVINTSSSSACDVWGISSVVTMTNLNISQQLPASSTTTATILAAGSFTMAPDPLGARPGLITVVLGDPRPAPEYQISFDPNGGDCTGAPLSIQVASSDWYALPTDGTGTYQCHRSGYSLVGWSRNGVLATDGTAEQAPDIAHGTLARAADHVTFRAVWRPKGAELTFDANVDASDRCVGGDQINISGAQRSEVIAVPPEELSGFTLPSSAPCTPPGHRLRGWSLTAGGDATADLSAAAPSIAPGSTLRLYAQWQQPGCPVTQTDKNIVEYFNLVNYMGDFTMQITPVSDDSYEVAIICPARQSSDIPPPDFALSLSTVSGGLRTGCSGEAPITMSKTNPDCASDGSCAFVIEASNASNGQIFSQTELRSVLKDRLSTSPSLTMASFPVCLG